MTKKQDADRGNDRYYVVKGTDGWHVIDGFVIDNGVISSWDHCQGAKSRALHQAAMLNAEFRYNHPDAE